MELVGYLTSHFLSHAAHIKTTLILVYKVVRTKDVRKISMIYLDSQTTNEMRTHRRHLASGLWGLLPYTSNSIAVAVHTSNNKPQGLEQAKSSNNNNNT
jgi:hypothetical protein